jgi:glycosyltransferase involved in cell wall biosynthesis
MNKTGLQKEVSKKARLFSTKVEEIINDHNIDIICAENFHIGLPPAYSILLHLTAGLKNIPLVLQLHSFAKTELQEELVNSLLWSQISCVSKSVAGDCFHKGADIDLLSTAYLGVNTKEFHPNPDPNNSVKSKLGLNPDDKIILTATRILLGGKNILKEKGVINLIQAFSKLSIREDKLHLLIAIGKSTNTLQNEFNAAMQMLEGFIKLNSAEEKTHVKLFQLDEMPDVYKSAEVFVLPSENETFGQVFIEAMASGVPVIGTNIGGIPEIISDSYNGFLVTPDDSTMLEQKLEMILNDEDLRASFREKGISNVKENFDFEKQLKDFFESLEQITKTN